MDEERILIVEDDRATREGLRRLIGSWGYQTETAVDGQDALTKITEFRPGIVVADLVMARMGGLELLRAIREDCAWLAFVMLTAQGTIETAVQAMKEGTYDYLTKPVDPQRLRIVLEKIAERQETRREVEALERQLRQLGSFGRMIGTNAEMRQVYRIIEQAAPTQASVLISGESGTGKELGSYFSTASAKLLAERAELASEKARLETVVETLEDAVAIWNRDGVLLFANPAMQVMLGEGPASPGGGDSAPAPSSGGGMAAAEGPEAPRHPQEAIRAAGESRRCCRWSTRSAAWWNRRWSWGGRSDRCPRPSRWMAPGRSVSWRRTSSTIAASGSA